MRNGGREKGGGGFERVSKGNYGESMVMEKFRVRKNDDKEEEQEEDERMVHESILFLCLTIAVLETTAVVSPATFLF